ncbi:class I SAM-dependent methyltransferase [Planctomicrobium sp. SH527]|uniref:class I SAM-dependent methyltransferase n=1 Tax=Planctomicrobium sp. SH527 TaxID=3448123 RepID=UPI003F5B5977
MQREQHWNSVYQSKSDTEVSWFEPEPQVSLELIRSVAPDGGSVIDVGGGTARLVDSLLQQSKPGQIAVLDVSEAALRKVKERLGEQAGEVHWVVGDVTEQSGLGQYDVWHDRAVFHFLTDAAERGRYAELAAQTVRPGGHAILGVFALDGPQKCSGLEVCRYDAAGLARELGPAFRLVREHPHRHVTPSGKVQSFCFAVFQRVPEEGDP